MIIVLPLRENPAHPCSCTRFYHVTIENIFYLDKILEKTETKTKTKCSNGRAVLHYLIVDCEAFEGVPKGYCEHPRYKPHRLRVNYPRKARSLFAPVVSAPAGSSGTSCSSSVGKYDVSVMERSRGTKGDSISRIDTQSTP
jgi:hypothetical protein